MAEPSGIAVVSDTEQYISLQTMVAAATDKMTRIASTKDFIISASDDHVAIAIPDAEEEAAALSSLQTHMIPDDIDFTKRLFELALVISFTVLVDLWKPFGKNQSSNQLVFIVLIMISFYFAVNGVLLNHKFPGSKMVKACILVALLSLIASFSLLLSALLPSNIKWLPWVLFAFTVGVGLTVFLIGLGDVVNMASCIACMLNIQ